jgi:hypothetical protein
MHGDIKYPPMIKEIDDDDNDNDNNNIVCFGID